MNLNRANPLLKWAVPPLVSMRSLYIWYPEFCLSGTMCTETMPRHAPFPMHELVKEERARRMCSPHSTFKPGMTLAHVQLQAEVEFWRSDVQICWISTGSWRQWLVTGFLSSLDVKKPCHSTWTWTRMEFEHHNCSYNITIYYRFNNPYICIYNCSIVCCCFVLVILACI